MVLISFLGKSAKLCLLIVILGFLLYNHEEYLGLFFFWVNSSPLQVGGKLGILLARDKNRTPITGVEGGPSKP